MLCSIPAHAPASFPPQCSPVAPAKCPGNVHSHPAHEALQSGYLHPSPPPYSPDSPLSLTTHKQTHHTQAIRHTHMRMQTQTHTATICLISKCSWCMGVGCSQVLPVMEFDWIARRQQHPLTTAFVSERPQKVLLGNAPLKHRQRSQRHLVVFLTFSVTM